MLGPDEADRFYLTGFATVGELLRDSPSEEWLRYFLAATSDSLGEYASRGEVFDFMHYYIQGEIAGCLVALGEAL